MQLSDKRPLVIYHANCTDGFSAAWCFHSHFGKDQCELVPATYGSEPPDVTGRSVYMVDFSYSREDMIKMEVCASRVVLIDHHKTAFDAVGDGIEGLHTFMDNLHSGAMLAWLYLNNDHHTRAPLMIKYVEDRDLWKFEQTASHEVNAFIASHDQNLESWDVLMSKDIEHLADIVNEGAGILRQKRKNVKEIARQHRLGDIFGHEGIPVCSCPGMYASDVGHELDKDKPFAVTYSDGSDSVYFSLRSRPEGVDVEELAKKLGGGGHKHAAGFKLRYDDAAAWSKFFDFFVY